MAHTKPRQRLDSNSAGNRKEERFSSSLRRPGKWMWPQRKRDSARLNFSKTVLECPAETNRPGILAEFDAFKIVRRSGNNLLPCTQLSWVWQLGHQQLINFSSFIFAIVACLNVIYIKPDLPSFPRRVKSNNVGFTELCNISFLRDKINTWLRLSHSHCHTKTWVYYFISQYSSICSQIKEFFRRMSCHSKCLNQGKFWKTENLVCPLRFPETLERGQWWFWQ